MRTCLHLIHCHAARWIVLAAGTAPVIALVGRLEGSSDPYARLRNGPGVANHPVNVVPSAAVSVPAQWPLGTGGTVTCMTCHTSLPRLNDPAGAELRGSASDSLDSKAFCMNCHREDGARTAAGAHWMAVSRAHPMKEEDRPAISHDGGVDRASRTCLSCHDGVSAADAGYETNLTRLRGFLGDKSRNHPIGVRYPQGGTQGVEVRLRPASLLPEAISLPGGYVSCNSCHNLYGTEAHRLSVPIEGSKLCLTCHDMD